jgi:hypothetical protein
MSIQGSSFSSSARQPGADDKYVPTRLDGVCKYVVGSFVAVGLASVGAIVSATSASAAPTTSVGAGVGMDVGDFGSEIDFVNSIDAIQQPTINEPAQVAQVGDESLQDPGTQIVATAPNIVPTGGGNDLINPDALNYSIDPVAPEEPSQPDVPVEPKIDPPVNPDSNTTVVDNDAVVGGEKTDSFAFAINDSLPAPEPVLGSSNDPLTFDYLDLANEIAAEVGFQNNFAQKSDPAISDNQTSEVTEGANSGFRVANLTPEEQALVDANVTRDLDTEDSAPIYPVSTGLLEQLEQSDMSDAINNAAGIPTPGLGELPFAPIVPERAITLGGSGSGTDTQGANEAADGNSERDNGFFDLSSSIKGQPGPDDNPTYPDGVETRDIWAEALREPLPPTTLEDLQKSYTILEQLSRGETPTTENFYPKDAGHEIDRLYQDSLPKFLPEMPDIIDGDPQKNLGDLIFESLPLEIPGNSTSTSTAPITDDAVPTNGPLALGIPNTSTDAPIQQQNLENFLRLDSPQFLQDALNKAPAPTATGSLAPFVEFGRGNPETGNLKDFNGIIDSGVKGEVKVPVPGIPQLDIIGRGAISAPGQIKDGDFTVPKIVPTGSVGLKTGDSELTIDNTGTIKGGFNKIFGSDLNTSASVNPSTGTASIGVSNVEAPKAAPNFSETLNNATNVFNTNTPLGGGTNPPPAPAPAPVPNPTPAPITIPVSTPTSTPAPVSNSLLLGSDPLSFSNSSPLSFSNSSPLSFSNSSPFSSGFGSFSF